MKRLLHLSAALSVALTLILSPKTSLADGSTFSADSDLSFAAAYLLCGSGDTIEITGPVSIDAGSYGTLDKSITVSTGSLTLSGGSYLVTASISGTVHGSSDVAVFVRGGSISLSGGTVYAPVSSIVSGISNVTKVEYADGSSESVTPYNGASWLSVTGKTVSEVTTTAGTFQKNSGGTWAKLHTITYRVDAAKGENDPRNPIKYLEGDGALTIYPPSVTTGNTFTGWSLSGLISADDPSDPVIIPASLLTGDLTLTAAFSGAAGDRGAAGGSLGGFSLSRAAAGASASSAAASGEEESENSEPAAANDGDTRQAPVRQARSNTTVSFAEGYSDADRITLPETPEKKTAALWIWLCAGGIVIAALIFIGRASAARARAEEERFGL